MRHVRVRNAIAQTLRDNPEGLTATEILEKLDRKKRNKVTNAKHVSTLIRGMKNIHVKCVAQAVDDASSWSNRGLNKYKVNVYIHEEEGAEI